MYHTTNEEIQKAQNQDKEALGNIIESNSGLIWNIVKRFSGRNYSQEELFQIGCIGFIKAIKRFDFKFEVKISTYAVPYILGEIKRFLRDDGLIKVSRSIKELSIKIRNIQESFFKETGEEITILELSKKLNVSKEDIAQALDSITPIDSIDEEIYKDDNCESKVNRISNQKDETSILVDKICLKSIIKNLCKRDKEIIMLRYYKEKTQTEVAKILGITQVQVSRIEKRILSAMKGKIEI